MNLIKPRITPLNGPQGRYPKLIIRHPSYPTNPLLMLPALDAGGVAQDVALIICGIIADNSWRIGWFSRSVDGRGRLEPNELLTGEVFYFVGDEESYRYPIYTSWYEWRLPATENDLPIAFAKLPIGPVPDFLSGEGGFMKDLKTRDNSCRLSGVKDFCEAAHLVPNNEKEWWASNMKFEFDIQSAFNGILLRPDLHQCFDKGGWIPMARRVEGRDVLVAYMLQTKIVSNQFAELWHHVEMHDLIGVDRRCLFARVAYSVLALHDGFLLSRQFARNETTLVRTRSGQLQELSAAEVQQRGRSHNSSPTKRARFAIDGANQCKGDGEDIDKEGGQEREPEWDEWEDYDHNDYNETEHERGRKRHRSSSPSAPLHHKRRFRLTSSLMTRIERKTGPSSTNVLPSNPIRFQTSTRALAK